MTVTKAPPPSPVAVIGSRGFQDLEKVRAFVRSLPPNACVVSGGARGVDQAAEAEALKCGLAVRSFRPHDSVSGFVVDVDESKHHLGFGNTSGHTRTLSRRYDSFTQAAHARNSMIVNEAVLHGGCVVAFWDGSSPGTQSVIAKARRAGVLYDVIHEDEPKVEGKL